MLRRGNPVQFHGWGQAPRSSPQPGAEGSQWNLYSPGTETFHCEGESKQLKACQQEPCPPDRSDPRSVQCAAYNNQEFMGRFYQWEPFRDVRGAQRCELNCRPIGYRFYVRHTEKVLDGTPCEAGSPDICVAGQCLMPGCDGILGSNRTLDSCGVCGGDHTTCKLVVGNFSDTDVPIGYHRILEIPEGATHILVKEMTRSPNYLALRSRSGKSIINGNWAVNPPGRYEAAGTIFVYSRPESDRREGESLTAEGPTTEPIDVYMIFQQDNPGVSYQFFVSLAQPDNSAADVHNPRQEFGARALVSTGHPMEPSASRVRPGLLQTQSHVPAQPPIPPSHSRRSHVVVPPPVSSSQSGRSHVVVPPPVSSSQSGRSPGTLQRNIRVPPQLPPPPPIQHNSEVAREFYWQQIGYTECSATCGKGESRECGVLTGCLFI
ncbi:ADAMTS-like protein 4 [Sphaerodactylus townsendi]|uniref:ADAMTS-like protein 4 n=1 Tax=Sphaerodactylus townsendi TaxID=933632 RepID=UPI00202725F8|nr:ADAMTS-like protein 4 [Sphaerodactylus townsendi]